MDCTLAGDLPSVEDKLLDPEDVAVVGGDDGHDGDLGLDGEVEGALLEGQQGGLLGVAAGALGEHVDALALGADLVGGAAHGLAGVLAVGAVEEDAAAEGHEPAEEGRLLERGLGGDAAVLGEHAAEHQHVELGLVVADEDGWADGVEVVVGVLNVEGDARGQAHGVLEAAGRGPLRELVEAEEAEDDGGDDAEERAEEQAQVRGQRAGHEGRLGDHGGQHEEEEGEGGVAGEEVPDVGEEGGHFDSEGGADSGSRRGVRESQSGEAAVGVVAPARRTVGRCERTWKSWLRQDKTGLRFLGVALEALGWSLLAGCRRRARLGNGRRWRRLDKFRFQNEGATCTLHKLTRNS